MADEKVSCATDASDSSAAADALAVRSGVYAILSRGFSYASEDVLEFIRGCGAEGEDGGDIEHSLAALRTSAASVSVEVLKNAYMRLFDPVSGPFPYETERKKLKDFQKAQIMADIMGFYRAFGVQPNGERGDHIAAELEFMHYLTLKEAHALRGGQLENASLCRDAQGKFFHEHLGTWTDELVSGLRARAQQNPTPFYTHLLDSLERFMECEKEELK